MDAKDKGISLEEALNKSVGSFCQAVKDIICNAKEIALSEQMKEMIWKMHFRIQLNGIGDNKDTIIEVTEPMQGESETADDVQAVEETFKKNDQIGLVKCEGLNLGQTAGTYIMTLSLRYEGEEREKAKILMKTILEMLVHVVDSLDMILQIDRTDIQEDFEKQFLCALKRNNFLEKYKESMKPEYSLPEWQILEKIGFEDYEKRHIKGTVCFVDESELQSVSKVVKFSACMEKNPWSVSYMRKMIEISHKGNICLLADKEQFNLTGMAYQDGALELMEHCLHICFMKKGEWKVCYGNSVLLYFKNGKYYLDEEHESICVQNQVEKIGIISKENCAVFNRILEQLDQAEHGALMIVAEDARDEADRLCNIYNRGIAVDIAVEDNNVELIACFAAVDGAILMTPDAKCWGFAVILDGEAKTRGKLDKGARYNSACNYITGTDRYAVIVSEDRSKGMKVEFGKDVKKI